MTEVTDSFRSRFEFKKELGKGGMGEVYLAYDACFIYKVCNALEYAATLGLLHRDIKPANVLLAAANTIKVMDFGTAYFTQSDETQVFDVGTLPYMPPEHFKKRPPTVQSDIYAVGVMMYLSKSRPTR